MAQLIDLTEYNELTHKIIGCAMTVHRKLGLGFPEVVYQRALAIELFKQGLRAEREVELPIYYDGEKVGSRRADFFVNRRVLVEIKACGRHSASTSRAGHQLPRSVQNPGWPINKLRHFQPRI